MLPALAPYFAAVTIICLLIVALEDVARMRIRNSMVVATVLAFVGYRIAGVGALPDGALLVAGSLFAFSLACWALGLVGGGDAKFLPVCGLFAGVGDIAPMIFLLSAGSLVLVLVYFGLRPLARSGLAVPAFAHRYVERGKLPFGVAMAFACAGILPAAA